jgi:prepilin-type processing-associated H-X9-DG protein
MYSDDNREKIPYCGLRQTGGAAHWTFDDLLGSYLGEPGNSIATLPTTFASATALVNDTKIMHCPSDKVLVSLTPAANYPVRRSYVMPTYTMNNTNFWPPNSSLKCGVGLLWNNDNADITWNSLDSKTTVNPMPYQQNGVRSSTMLDGVGTILVTEYIGGDNILGTIWGVGIANANVHLATASPQNTGVPKTQDFHNSYYNYLMADGHVETLQPAQTLGITNRALTLQTGMWTILSGD